MAPDATEASTVPLSRSNFKSLIGNDFFRPLAHRPSGAG